MADAAASLDGAGLQPVPATSATSYADLILQAVPKLLVLYWVLATASVAVTLLPLPVPKAFKCVPTRPCKEG